MVIHFQTREVILMFIYFYFNLTKIILPYFYYTNNVKRAYVVYSILLLYCSSL